jgi:hypothetical protein
MNNPIILQGITGSLGVYGTSGKSASYYANGGMSGVTSAFFYCQHYYNPNNNICHRCKYRLVRLSGGNCYRYEGLPVKGDKGASL